MAPKTWLAFRFWMNMRAVAAMIIGMIMIAKFAWSYKSYPYLSPERAHEYNQFYLLHGGILLVCVGLLAIGFRYWRDQKATLQPKK
jgi:Na+/proline symporter